MDNWGELRLDMGPSRGGPPNPSMLPWFGALGLDAASIYMVV